MFASSWLRQLQGRWFPRRALRRAPIRRVRPCLEVLEDCRPRRRLKERLKNLWRDSARNGGLSSRRGCSPAGGKAKVPTTSPRRCPAWLAAPPNGARRFGFLLAPAAADDRWLG
jgi:hypothetical protein